MPMQPGDVKNTYAETKKLAKCIDYKPNTSIEKGVLKFVEWYKTYHQINLN